MVTSTSHFVSRAMAFRYYRQEQGESFDPKSLNEKIKEGIITIGRPVMDRKYHQFVNGEGRWCYIEYENRKAVKK